MLQMKMSVPLELEPRVIAASVQIQTAVSSVIVLEPVTKETHVKLVNTVEQHNFTFSLKHIIICELPTLFICLLKFDYFEDLPFITCYLLSLKWWCPTNS